MNTCFLPRIPTALCATLAPLRWLAALALSLGAAAATAAPAVQVDWSANRQSIDGFGASSAWYASDLQSMPEPARTTILDLLFSSSGAGLSILRNRIPFEISPSPNVYDWTKDAGAFWLAGEAKRRGAGRVLATPWTPPGYMKTNGSPFNGGSLKTTSYQAYADYLSRYVRQYKSLGIDTYAVSVQNEPELSTSYESCLWTAAQFQTFIRDYLMPTFKRDGVTAKVMAAESNLWYEGMVQATLADANARSGLDIVAAHPYFAGEQNSGYDVFPYTKKYGKRLWATEVSMAKSDDIADALFWATLIHRHMTVPESNAFLFWWGASGKDASAGEDLITIDVASGNYAVHKRLYAMANFSRFVRPGYTRIDATADPAPGVHVSAYKNDANGQLVMVAVNENAAAAPVSFNLFRYTTASVSPYRTSATESMAPLSHINVANGSFGATLAARSITTFTASGTAGGGVADVPATVAEMNSLQGAAAASGDLTNAFIVNTGGGDEFDGDNTRMARQNNTDEWLDYKTPDNFKQMDVTVFYNESLAAGGIALKASSDGITYTPVNASLNTPLALPGYWFKSVFTVGKASLPAGTKYLRIAIPKNSKAAWSPQLGQVRISYYR